MAKSTKSGLGRGLNSLLGGSYEEAVPMETTSQRVLVKQEPDSASKTSQLRADSPRPTQTKDVVPSAAQEEESIVDAGSHITIKGVVERSTNEVSIDLITPNPYQPRINFKQEEMEELVSSIEKDGLLQPILVRCIGAQKYQIIAGERRWQACKMAGLKTVPVRIKEADDNKALELALIENIQRSDLNPIEEAYGYRRMMERCNLTQSEVAQAMSKGRSTVANALRLLELPEKAQKLLFEEKITAGHARAILSIPTTEGRQKLTEKLTVEKLSVRETESIARLMSGKGSSSTQAKKTIPSSYRSVARALRDVLDTNVKIKSVKGKNKIEIEFKDEDDLKRLFKELINASVS